MNILISLSENDKRLIFALLLVFILVFVLIGYIGFLITRVMKWQGKKLDHIVADPVVTRVITDKKHFKRYARKKNWRLFVKQSYIAVIILTVGGLVLLFRDIFTRDWSYNVFEYKQTGFGTILFIWDFSKCITRPEGMGLVLNWPELINTPHLEAQAWASYIFVTCLIIGGVWYLIALQALISRTIRMYQLSTSAFEKTLEGFNQNQQAATIAAARYQETTQNPAPDNNSNNNQSM